MSQQWLPSASDQEMEEHQWTDRAEGTFVVTPSGYLTRANGAWLATLPSILLREIMRLAAVEQRAVAERARLRPLLEQICVDVGHLSGAFGFVAPASVEVLRRELGLKVEE